MEWASCGGSSSSERWVTAEKHVREGWAEVRPAQMGEGTGGPEEDGKNELLQKSEKRAPLPFAGSEV
jgi:hypothetical protein